MGTVFFGCLGRYLMRQNLFLMMVTLGIGICIYLLSDIFDRLDDFVAAGLGFQNLAVYLVVKIPMIVSQILPAVFFLSMVIQLGLLSRSREMLALRAGGVSLRWLIRFFVIYAVIWSIVQLLFSQFIGVYGEREAFRIWKEDVRGVRLDKDMLQNIWFRDGDFIVEAKTILPKKNSAQDVTLYEFDMDSQRLIKIVHAENARIEEYGWRLFYFTEIDTTKFSTGETRSRLVPIIQDISAFTATYGEDRMKMPIIQLSRVIKELEESGSNVENLKTTWHSRWSYAFNILTMAFIALALYTITENIYLNVTLSLILVFIQYSAFMLGVSAGQEGALPPMIAAWSGNMSFILLSSLRLWWASSIKLRSIVEYPFTFFQNRNRERYRA